MSSRGRGRGGRGGASKSFNKEQLSALGVGGPEITPGPVTQPPAIYPLLERKPVPLVPSMELDYLLLLRQEFIEHMQLSPAYLKLREDRKQRDKAIDKLVAQLPNTKEKFDWKLLPIELRPKLLPGNFKKTVQEKPVDVTQRLNQLEQIEETTVKSEVKVKTEVKDDEEEETEMMEEDEDEEMDDGTDYANNYFDNGEAYEDEDDNLDDGPIY